MNKPAGYRLARGDCIRMERLAFSSGPNSGWLGRINEMLSDYRADRVVAPFEGRSPAVSLLSYPESTRMIRQSPMIGATSMNAVMSQLLRSLQPAMRRHTRADVETVGVFNDQQRIILLLESEAMAEERRHIAHNLGTILGVNGKIQAGEPHITIAKLSTPDLAQARAVASDLQEAVPETIMFKSVNHRVHRNHY